MVLFRGMIRNAFPLALLPILIIALFGPTLAQDESAPVFTYVTTLGRAAPAGLLYNPLSDRAVYVTDDGALVIAETLNFVPLFTLADGGNINAYAFSPDGRALAAAIDRRIDVWDAVTGALQVSFEPPGANYTQGPLTWSDDSGLLLLETNVPAPQELRRSENDTVTLPWLWDVAAARDERRSILPGQVEAQPYFNITVASGITVVGERTLVQGLPARLLVGDLSDSGAGIKVPSNQVERDPIYVWRSLTDPLYYLDTRDGGFVQLDPQNNHVYRLPLSADLGAGGLSALAEQLALPQLARRSGPILHTTPTALGTLLLGEDYSSFYGPVTLYLLDLIAPHTPALEPDRRPQQLALVLVETEGSTFLELVTPGSAAQIALSPDGRRLAVRRAGSGLLQPVDIYDVASGAIERTLLARSVGEDGLFAFTADSRELLVDFARYDAHTGALLRDDPTRTDGFTEAVFTDAGDAAIATSHVDPANLSVWDLATGRPTAGHSVPNDPNVIYTSEDKLHSLSLTPVMDGVEVTIRDLAGETQRRFLIPAAIPGGDPASVLNSSSIAVSPGWTRFAAAYTPSPSSQHSGAGLEFVVYEPVFDAATDAPGEARVLLHLAGDDALPYADQWFFSDDRTLVLQQYGTASSSHTRFYGLDFHASGLPQCVVDAFPESWAEWEPVWRWLALNLPTTALMNTARRACAAVETAPDVAALSAALTPTAPPQPYTAGSTAVPINVPGVPACLTAAFRSEALDYAALWREVTTGLTPEQAEEAARMLCEGLVYDPNQVQPTPTLNPNSLIVVTPTPLPEGPETVSGDTGTQTVMVIDVDSGARELGDHLPPFAPRRDARAWTDEELVWLKVFFAQDMRREPGPLALSRDGTLAAEINARGLIDIYRLAEPFAGLFAARNQAEAPALAVGLAPTATRTYAPLNDVQPTLTPTVTLTPLPPLAGTPEPGGYGAPEDLCPLREWLETDEGVSALPGRLLVMPVAEVRREYPLTGALWVLNPDGTIFFDPAVPPCGANNCQFAPGGGWVLVSGQSITVSRPDGSEAIELFGPEEMNYQPQSLTWADGDTLLYRSAGTLPGSEDYGPLIRTLDLPEGQLSEPAFSKAALLPETLDGLPVQLLLQQPPDGDWFFVSTPFGVYNQPDGQTFILWNVETGERHVLGRSANTPGYQWRPDGALFFYRLDDGVLRQFNAATGAFTELASMPAISPDGFSPSGRLHARWTTAKEVSSDGMSDGYIEALQTGELPPRITVWDSDTNTVRRFCVPLLGADPVETPLFWSPDSRYLAFIVHPPLNGDSWPAPTTTPTRVPPTPTAVPLNVQYEAQFPVLLVLDTVTGQVTGLSREAVSITAWVQSGWEGTP